MHWNIVYIIYTAYLSVFFHDDAFESFPHTHTQHTHKQPVNQIFCTYFVSQHRKYYYVLLSQTRRNTIHRHEIDKNGTSNVVLCISHELSRFLWIALPRRYFAVMVQTFGAVVRNGTAHLIIEKPLPRYWSVEDRGSVEQLIRVGVNEHTFLLFFLVSLCPCAICLSSVSRWYIV